MASSAFVKSLAGSKSSIKKMRDVQPKEYSKPDIENGTYIFAVKAEAGVTPKKEVPYVKFEWSIQDEGPEFGKSDQSTFFLEGDDPEKVEKNFESLGLAFKALLNAADLDISDAADIELLVDAVNKEKCYARGNLKKWVSGDKFGYNVWFKERLEIQ